MNYNGDYPYYNGKKGIYRAKTVSAGSLPNENSWGCYDFHGNVSEWCSDWHGEYTEDDIVNPTGPSNGQVCVLRGGGWFSSARNVRSARRDSVTHGYRYYGYAGLRFVRGT